MIEVEKKRSKKYFQKMNLKHLADKTLLSETKRLTSREREVTLELLHHIKEVERRKLYSELKYCSMMDFLIKELGFSEGAAIRRLQSARILQVIPEVEDKIKEGILSLSNIQKASGFFKNENIESPEKKKEVLEKIENQTAREAERTLLSLGSQKPNLPKETIKPVTEDIVHWKVNLKFTTMAYLNKVRSLLGKYKLDDECLISILKEAEENITKRKFKLTDKGRETESSSRIFSHSARRQVYERSEGKCENCGGHFLLQFDHGKPGRREENQPQKISGFSAFTVIKGQG